MHCKFILAGMEGFSTVLCTPGQVVLVVGTCVPIFFEQLNPPSRDQTFSFTNPATKFAKKGKTKGVSSRNATSKHENATVLKKQKRTIYVFRCWLYGQLGILKLSCHLRKPCTIHVVFIASLQAHHAAEHDYENQF